MASMIISGGRPLSGVVDVGGSKNGALPVLAASLLVPGETVVENVPDIEDVATMIDMLRALGVKVTPAGAGTLRIDATNIASTSAPHQIVRKMRASFYVAGPLLARCGEATVPVPGGCVLGPRPVNFHVEGFEALGAEVTEQHGVVQAKAKRLHGSRIFLDPRFRSVGATHNIMMAAVLAEGTTIIENASREPETVDCARFLNKCGARISGSGSTTLAIQGVKELHGCSHTVIPDRMEAGTFLLAGMATRGDVTTRKVDLTHLEVLLRTLRKTGARLVTNGHSVRIIAESRVKAFDAITGPYPGFPTDMQPCTVAVMALADGVSHMHETIFDARFGYTDELLRMGAKVRVVDQLAIVEGVEHLWGAPVEAPDIRAGAGLVVAALAAKGQTELSGAGFLDRGYENLVEKLAALGAEVSRPGRRKLCWA